MSSTVPLEPEACYRAVQSRDRRFDGMFYLGVRTTGIYCRPSCPARTPHRRNVTFHRTAAAAQAAGYRACKRCAPDATPGSPEWDLTADVAGRAMRLVADGAVDREGVTGLARRLGYSERQLNRVLTAQLGAGPLALARARRAQQARLLVESTGWPLDEVAYAAGFGSVRQFNDTMQEVYAVPPSAFRTGRHGFRAAEQGVTEQEGRASGVVRLTARLAVRTPFAARELWQFLAVHAVAGVESAGHDAGGRWYARTLRLPCGPATMRVDLADPPAGTPGVHRLMLRLGLNDVRDVGVALERCRRLLDADADPVAVDAALGADGLLAPSVDRHPGLRVPGSADGDETALRIVLGQQVSLRSGVRLAGTLTDLAGDPLPPALREHGLDRLFPSAEAVGALDPALLPMPRARAAALRGLAAAMTSGEVVLDRSVDRDQARTRLLALPGVGPWTAACVSLRALGDPDVFLPTDVGVRRVLHAHGVTDPAEYAERWRPWRSAALLHLWTGIVDELSVPLCTVPDRGSSREAVLP